MYMLSLFYTVQGEIVMCPKVFTFVRLDLPLPPSLSPHSLLPRSGPIYIYIYMYIYICISTVACDSLHDGVNSCLGAGTCLERWVAQSKKNEGKQTWPQIAHYQHAWPCPI